MGLRELWIDENPLNHQSSMNTCWIGIFSLNSLRVYRFWLHWPLYLLIYKWFSSSYCTQHLSIYESKPLNHHHPRPIETGLQIEISFSASLRGFNWKLCCCCLFDCEYVQKRTKICVIVCCTLNSYAFQHIKTRIYDKI